MKERGALDCRKYKKVSDSGKYRNVSDRVGRARGQGGPKDFGKYKKVSDRAGGSTGRGFLWTLWAQP